jgi:hypothetical protein
MVNAIVTVNAPSSGDITATDYEISLGYIAREDSGTLRSATVTAVIPRGTESVKANRLLREAVADHMQTNFSLTIDPSDIYFA